MLTIKTNETLTQLSKLSGIEEKTLLTSINDELTESGYIMPDISDYAGERLKKVLAIQNAPVFEIGMHIFKCMPSGEILNLLGNLKLIWHDPKDENPCDNCGVNVNPEVQTDAFESWQEKRCPCGHLEVFDIQELENDYKL